MKRLAIYIAIGAAMLLSVWFLKFGDAGTAAVWSLSDGGKWLLPLVAIAALIDSINPCAFSILILTVAFLLTIGKLRSKVLEIGGFYILGIFFAYMLIGLGILQALHIFNTPHFMAKVGATLLVVLGAINLIGEFVPKFPLKLKIPEGAHRAMAFLMEKASIPSAFALGALVGLCEFPCTGGPYLMVLGLLHDNVTYYSGLGYLALYNLIFIAPLVVLLLIASNSALLEKVQAWQQQERRWMRLGGGVAMVALGVIIFLL